MFAYLLLIGIFAWLTWKVLSYFDQRTSTADERRDYEKAVNKFIKHMKCESCQSDLMPTYKIEKDQTEVITCCCKEFSEILHDRINNKIIFIDDDEQINEDVQYFVYRDSKGRITGRVLTDVSKNDYYIEGLCMSAMDRRTFRKDRILEKVESRSELNAALERHINNQPYLKKKAYKKEKENLEICFTGFKKEEKCQLINMAKEADLIVRNDVVSSLDILCCGDNPGPVKTQNAFEQHIKIMDAEQFKLRVNRNK